MVSGTTSETNAGVASICQLLHIGNTDRTQTASSGGGEVDLLVTG